jgi:hypothetical protein
VVDGVLRNQGRYGHEQRNGSKGRDNVLHGVLAFQLLGS